MNAKRLPQIFVVFVLLEDGAEHAISAPLGDVDPEQEKAQAPVKRGLADEQSQKQKARNCRGRPAFPLPGAPQLDEGSRKSQRAQPQRKQEKNGQIDQSSQHAGPATEGKSVDHGFVHDPRDELVSSTGDS